MANIESQPFCLVSLRGLWIMIKNHSFLEDLLVRIEISLQISGDDDCSVAKALQYHAHDYSNTNATRTLF